MTVQMFVYAGLMLALTQVLGCQRTATPQNGRRHGHH